MPQEEIDRALEEDRARSTAEYLAHFRSDLERFVSLEVVENCVGSYCEMGPLPNCSYVAFVDPSGGSERSMTMAIAHLGGVAVSASGSTFEETHDRTALSAFE
jgi:hypothetical protein